MEDLKRDVWTYLKGVVVEINDTPLIVIIHLGPNPSEYIYKNLVHMKKTSQSQLLVVTNNVNLSKFCQEKNIEFHIYKSQLRVSDLISNATFDANFRGGFWKYTIERFFALEDVHKNFPNQPLLHVESDVLLLKNFPLRAIIDKGKLMWCEVGLTHDSAALLFTPNLEQTSWLIDQIRGIIGENTSVTDMTILNRIRLNNPNSISLFPSIENPKRTKDGYVATDPSALGMWLLGTDPRNSYGFVRRYHWWAEAYNLNCKIDLEYNSEVLYLNKRGMRIRIVNLHNHSKNSFFFSSSPYLLQFFVWTSRMRFMTKYPSPKFYLQAIWSRNFLHLRLRHIKTIKSILFSILKQ